LIGVLQILFLYITRSQAVARI